MQQSIRDSQAHLDQIIQDWSKVMNVEQFLKGVEDRASMLPDDERLVVLRRLELAREFLGTQSPLGFFISWKTPSERYRPAFDAGNEAPNEASTGNEVHEIGE